MSVPATRTEPASIESRPAMQLSSVDLPTPDSPTTATNSPAREREVDVGEDRARAVALGEPGDLEHRHQPRRPSASRRATRRTDLLARVGRVAGDRRGATASRAARSAGAWRAGASPRSPSRRGSRGRRRRARPTPGDSRPRASTAAPACRSPRARRRAHLVDEAGVEHRREALGDARVQPGAVDRLERDQRRRSAVGRAVPRRERPAAEAVHLERALDALAVVGRQARGGRRVDRRELGVQRGPAVARGALRRSRRAPPRRRRHRVEAVEQRLEVEHRAADQQRQRAARADLGDRRARVGDEARCRIALAGSTMSIR